MTIKTFKQWLSQNQPIYQKLFQGMPASSEGREWIDQTPVKDIALQFAHSEDRFILCIYSLRSGRGLAIYGDYPSMDEDSCRWGSPLEDLEFFLDRYGEYADPDELDK